MLMNLFPNDTGLSIPALWNNYAFKHENEDEAEVQFPEDSSARPYSWAQWICGFHHLKRNDTVDSNIDSYRPEPALRSVIAQVFPL